MAFNPNGFQTVYGFSMLDEVHNFMPELLYDDQIFTDTTLLWMRHRIRTLFPVFVRQQNLYSIYHAQTRRNDHNQWQNNLNPPAGPLAATTAGPLAATTAGPLAATTAGPVAAPPVHAAPAPPPLITPFLTPVRTRVRTGNPPPVSRRVRSDENATNDVIRELLGSAFLVDNILHNTVASNFMFDMRTTQEDVPVIPTSAEIATGSTEVPYSDVPSDASCAVCQEHGEAEAWRKIHCGHLFHDRCIMPWFQRNVHCPVCRADVRDSTT
jgi:hypothetical protein